MSFVRLFDVSKVNVISDNNLKLFERLKFDVKTGEVFPTVRKNEIHFYHKGGCLYKWVGNSLLRDPNYIKYRPQNIISLDDYEIAKSENETRYATNGKATERQLLDRLNVYTFNTNHETKVVVLDVEVRLNGKICGNKKCDMVLMNTETNQIMFVEGKLFKDNRVYCAEGFTPQVINQVENYTAGLEEQAGLILLQYSSHIQIINALFGTRYEKPSSLISPAKLLVYETPKNPTKHGLHSIKTINSNIGINNVMWVTEGEVPGLDKIWSTLCN